MTASAKAPILASRFFKANQEKNLFLNFKLINFRQGDGCTQFNAPHVDQKKAQALPAD
jgi:hypothetical protein